MLLDTTDLTPTIKNAAMSANCFGLVVATKEGGKATLAVVDESGEVLEAGDHIAQAAWHLMNAARNNFLIGKGHLLVKL